jgi:predicted Zn finger-like uncharacterized protein
MSVVADCPSCGTPMRIPDAVDARHVRCPKCGAHLALAEPPAAPPPRRAPPPDEEGPRRPRRPPARRRREEWDDDPEADRYDPPPGRRAREGTDAPGVISLVFGCISVVCLMMGCFTFGLTYIAAAPLALVGGACGFFGRGNLRVAGLVLNLLVLVPAVVILVLWMVGVSLQAITPAPGRR